MCVHLAEFAKLYPSHSCSPQEKNRKDGSSLESRKLAEICANFLCGTYELDGGVQVGTCLNRWYDKVSLPSFPRSCSPATYLD